MGDKTMLSSAYLTIVIMIVKIYYRNIRSGQKISCTKTYDGTF